MARTVLPFGLDRASKDSLKDQLAEGIREAIRMGFYRSGDILPSWNRMADELDVSEIVVRSAYRRLAAEGLIVSRPRIGSVVQPSKTPIWRGHVLCAMQDFDFNPFQAGLVGCLREQLSRNGFLFSQATTLYSKSGKFDCASLAVVFKRPVDLVIVTQGGRDIEEWLSAGRIPFVVIGGEGDPLPGCVARIDASYEKAIDKFTDKCRKRGISAVEIVRFRRPSALASALSMALAARGVETIERRLNSTWGPGRVEMAERAGFDFVERRLSRRSFRFPEIYFATDDYLAKGMLAAFMAHGVDVPGDVRFACVASSGFRPLYVKSLSMVEGDPYGRGEDVAARILSWLTEHRPISRSVRECRFVEGETFP